MTCSVEGCERKYLAKGLCGTHYQRKRTGVPLDRPVRRRKPGSTCVYRDCNRPHEAHGFCELHYKRWKYGRPLHGREPARCAISGCLRKHARHGLCHTHAARSKRGRPLDVPVGKLRRLAAIGTLLNGVHGYLQIRTTTGWKIAHRHVMEQHIGRPVRKDETVHHKNGIRDDNRIENLELRPGNHPQGVNAHDAVEHARWIISTYGDLLDRGLI